MVQITSADIDEFCPSIEAAYDVEVLAQVAVNCVNMKCNPPIKSKLISHLELIKTTWVQALLTTSHGRQQPATQMQTHTSDDDLPFG